MNVSIILISPSQ